MPTKYIHFTDEQKEQARQTDLCELLRSQGEKLKRSGSEYEWRDGSQKVTIRGNLWFHQYDQQGGDAIDFVRRFYNKDYPEAVEYLLGGCNGTLTVSPPIERTPPKPFELPPRNDNMRRVYAYLLSRRGLDRDVVYTFAHRQMIYESAQYHNAVFVGFDQEGVPRHANMRGTGSESTFKGNADSSIPEYSFHWSGRSKYLLLFEGPIDTRMLKEHNVDVYFEEQGIHSIQPGAEFYITIYGSIAQSESENISANVRWGKAQSAKEGNVPFHYKRFLGYRRGSDGKPEIDPEQAVVVKRIYERFLAGDSLATIANDLNTDGIPTPSGVGKWQRGTIESILTNEKYKGDAILNKTYIRDCLSKKVMINNGERPKYYVENNHPAIIDSATFGRVQEEMARRCGKRKVKQVGTKTEQGRYSSKYALTELLICGECGTPYRRCTWAANGKKKVVWRCINRLDYGKKYCHYSPSIEESVLQEAIMKAVMQTAKQNAEVLKTLKLLSLIHISEPTRH